VVLAVAGGSGRFQHVTQRYVIGTVRVKLDRAPRGVVGRQSADRSTTFSLATYDTGDAFEHTAAEGFVKLWACASRVGPGASHSFPRGRSDSGRTAVGGPVLDWTRRAMQAFGNSLPFDQRMWREDIAATAAHARGSSGRDPDAGRARRHLRCVG